MGLLSLLAAGCTPSSPVDTPKMSDMQAAVITYMYWPQFSFPGFTEQALGFPIKLEHYNETSQQLYVSVDSSAYMHMNGLASICMDTTYLHLGKREGDFQKIDNVRYRNLNRIFFRIPGHQLRLDSSQIISRDFEKLRYEVSLDELTDLYTAAVLYNSPAMAEIGRDTNGNPIAVLNHNASIALRGEPSLSRLARQLTGEAASPEEKAQRLLDFVTNEIAYSGNSGMETLIRPNGVLMSGRTDCSGKVVLYASLLEQVHIPYLLIYQASHISVAVAGDFPDQNQMGFTHEGRQYSLAETTAEGFVLGKSQLSPPITPDDFMYIQRPGKNTRLFSVAAQDSVPFLTHDL